MLYLAGTSRPDISYSVHQCARFSHSPKHSHEIAVKHIARYLKGTRDKGFIMKPNMIDNLQFNLYADADFAGLLPLRISWIPFVQRVEQEFCLR